jgi:hypothetical protein
MIEYILTEKERKAIKRYLQDKAPNDYIHLIRHRAKVSFKALEEDLNLLNLLIEN